MNRFTLREDFPHKYRAKEVKVVSVGSTYINPAPFHEPRMSGSTKNILIEPANAPTWVAEFKGGRPNDISMSGLLTCPNPQHLCVIVNGQVHFVDVYTQMEVGSSNLYDCGISRVEVNTKHGLLLFCCPAGIWAWGREGLVWDNGTIADDELQLRGVTEDAIKGIAVRSFAPITFEIEIATGECRCRPLDFETFEQ